MTPEEKARQKIDRMFTDAGWDVIDREEYSAGMTAVAIREGLLKCNKEADYFFFLTVKPSVFLKRNVRKWMLRLNM